MYLDRSLDKQHFAVATRPTSPAVRSKPLRILVLGGAGFIGCHVVAALTELGADISIGSRKPRRSRKKFREQHDAIDWQTIRLESMLATDNWRQILVGYDVVINCVGILRQRGHETYERLHHLAPAALAGCAAQLGIRFIHVSALGLDNPVRSRFLTSKKRGEIAIQQAGGDWHIIRPSLLEGEGGLGARWIRRVANWPVHFIPVNANGRIAAFDVSTLGERIAAIAVQNRCNEQTPIRIHELGGAIAQTMADYLQHKRQQSGLPPAIQIILPAWVARLTAHVCDVLHLTPYSFGHYELLRFDNVPFYLQGSPNQATEILSTSASRC